MIRHSATMKTCRRLHTRTLLIADKWINVIQNVHISITLVCNLQCYCSLLAPLPTSQTHTHMSVGHVRRGFRVSLTHQYFRCESWVCKRSRESNSHIYAGANDWLFGIRSCLADERGEKWNLSWNRVGEAVMTHCARLVSNRNRGSELM